MANHPKEKVQACLDTNTYLHYMRFNEIDWPSVLGADHVEIVVHAITMRELAKHAELHQHRHIRERARSILKYLHSLLGQPQPAVVRDGVSLRFEDREPDVDYRSERLDPAVQDDHLIASAIMLRKEGPHEVVIVTSDVGLTLVTKARRFQMKSIQLPEEYRLPHQE